MVNYNKIYKSTADIFGKEADEIIRKNYNLIDNAKPVLDIGAGQGRNSKFLAEKGFSVVCLEPSQEGCKIIKSKTENFKSNIKIKNCGFEKFKADEKYSAVLIMGIIQLLKREDITKLVQKIKEITEKDSIIFVSAFSTEDESFQKDKESAKKIGKNSFREWDGNIKTYLEPSEILDLFDFCKTLYHWEDFGEKHRHGDGPIEQHHRILAIFQVNGN